MSLAPGETRHGTELPTLLRELADAVDKDRGHSQSLLTRTMREAADALDAMKAAAT